MKRFLTGTLALTLLATTAATAFAQDGGGRGRWRENGGGQDGRGRHGAMADQGADAARDERRAAREARHADDDGGGRRNGMGRGSGGAPAPAPETYAAPSAPAPQWSGERRQRGDGGSAPAPQVYAAPSAPAPQWNGQRRQRGDGGQGWQGQTGGGSAPAPQWSGERRQQPDGGRGWDGHRDRGQTWHGERRPEWNGARQGFDHRGWEQRRPHYDRRHYPPVYRTQHRYRGPVYQPPYGFYARSWGFGDYLPRGWYAQEYRILDWWEYGLPIPPVGYDWVRIGDDAVLIDSFNGRVVQVVYDLFW